MKKQKVSIQEALREQKPIKTYESEDEKAKILSKKEKIQNNQRAKQISLYLFENEIELLDKLVKLNVSTRSSYLRRYIMEEAKKEGLI